MTLAMQFLDLYFFAQFKYLYGVEMDNQIRNTDKPKLTAAEKRIKRKRKEERRASRLFLFLGGRRGEARTRGGG